MPRKIFITEEMADKFLKYNDVNEELVNKLDNHETFFGDNQAFPPTDGLSFEHMLAMKGYESVRDVADDDILNLSVEEKKTLLQNIATRCQELEEKNKKSLEKLCFNIVNKMFAIPNGAITFKCHLVRDVSSHERSIRAKSEDSPEMEYDSVKEMKSLRLEVAKRQIINTLIMGAALQYSKLPKQFIGDVYEIDAELPKLYSNYAILNSLILYEDGLHEITEQNKYQAGMVDVRLCGPGKRTLIESFGTVFPVMLCESIRGFMELFSSHGLPEKKTSAEYVMKKSDCVEAEMWAMILGPEMWNIFVSTLGDMDMKYLPLLFTNLCELDGQEFCDTMQEVFAKTKSGMDIMRGFVSDVMDEIDYEDFEDSLAMKNMSKNMIADEYLTPEELDLI